MDKITYQTHKTPEPNEDHLDIEDQLHQEMTGSNGKSMARLLSERDRGLYKGEDAIEIVQIISNGSQVEKSLSDILPKAVAAHHDKNGYLIDLEDAFWQKTSCHQISALIGIPGTTSESLKEYEKTTGTTGYIEDHTQEVSKRDLRPDDIITFTNGQGGRVVHSCNIVAPLENGDFVVVTKDGRGPSVPIRLRKLSEVDKDYSKNYPQLSAKYRRGVLPEDPAGNRLQANRNPN